MNNDALFDILMQRETAKIPQVPPSSPTKTPQRAKRWDNAQQIQKAYANNWSPNPVLLRAALGHR